MDEGYSGLPAWLRWLEKSWRIGRFFGVEVRLHILTFLVPLITLLELSRDQGLSTGEVWALTAIIAVGLYVVIWTHEMGHILAGRRWHIRTSLITLSPLGGVAHMQAAAPSPGAEIAISFAGPATHLVWLAVFWPLARWVYPDVWVVVPPYGIELDLVAFAVQRTYDVNLGLFLFNLLPFFPMDGGRILRGILALRLHPNRASMLTAKIGRGGAIVLGIAGFIVPGIGGGLMIAIAITNFFACRNEILLARWGDGPYGPRRDAWETDSEAWKHGGRVFDDTDKSPGFFERRRLDKAEAEAARQVRHEASAREELDALLGRVAEAGLDGLTARERERLQSLSKSLRSSSGPRRR